MCTNNVLLAALRYPADIHTAATQRTTEKVAVLGGLTLACDDAYSKLVEVVTFADVSGEDCVGKSLLQIWKLRFGHKA